MIPIKTTIEDLNVLLKFLRPTFAWVPVARVKANLGSKVTDNRKLETARYLGLVERDGQSISITDQGRAYSSAQDFDLRANVIREQLAKTPLYRETVSWMYHSKSFEPTKTDVAEQWHKHHGSLLQGAQGAALTDGVIVFMRVAETAGLGKFITAGRNRPETKFRGDVPAIEKFAEAYLLGEDEPLLSPIHPSDADPTVQGVPDDSIESAQATESVKAEEPETNGGRHVRQYADSRARPDIQVNVQIQLGGDATAETVAEVFKNLRRYVLNDPGETLAAPPVVASATLEG